MLLFFYYINGHNSQHIVHERAFAFYLEDVMIKGDYLV